MSALNGFYKASFAIGGKIAYFYARVSQEPRIGRKTIVHDYPQSDTRYVQDNGKIAGIYSLQVQIQETTSSAYKRSIKKLREVLETPGIGVLTHPELGKKKVVATDNSRTANLLSENGLSNFSLTFLESDENKYPTITNTNIGVIGRLYDKLFSDNQTFLGASLENVTKFVEGYNRVRDSVQDITSIINDAVSTINGIADEVSALVADIADFQTSINELIQTPTNLALRFNNIWGAIGNITDNFSDMFTLSLNVYNNKPSTTTINAQSPITNNINNNIATISNYNAVAALNLAYISAVNIDFQSQEDVNKVIGLLNNAFYSLDPNSVDESIYYSLQDMRNQVRLYLENLRISLPFLRALQTNSVPASILAYNLYEDSTRADQIVNFNNIDDPAFIDGNINILSS